MGEHIIRIIKRSGFDGQKYSVSKDEVSFGAEQSCDIRVKVPNVDKIHTVLDFSNDKVTIHNKSAKFPTMLNGDAIAESATLKHGDVFTIINRSFRYESLKESDQLSEAQEKENHTTPPPNKKRKSKIVFGPELTPEEFDKKLPPAEPICRGRTPPRRGSTGFSILKGSGKTVPTPGILKDVDQPEELDGFVVPSPAPRTPKSPRRSSATSAAADVSSRSEVLDLGATESPVGEVNNSVNISVNVSLNVSEVLDLNQSMSAGSPAPPGTPSLVGVEDEEPTDLNKSVVMELPVDELHTDEATPPVSGLGEMDMSVTESDASTNLSSATDLNSTMDDMFPVIPETRASTSAAPTPDGRRKSKRKSVRFGPMLSPEEYDKNLPANTPIRKGALPPRYSVPNPQLSAGRTPLRKTVALGDLHTPIGVLQLDESIGSPGSLDSADLDSETRKRNQRRRTMTPKEVRANVSWAELGEESPKESRRSGRASLSTPAIKKTHVDSPIVKSAKSRKSTNITEILMEEEEDNATENKVQETEKVKNVFGKRRSGLKTPVAAKLVNPAKGRLSPPTPIPFKDQLPKKGTSLHENLQRATARKAMLNAPKVKTPVTVKTSPKKKTPRSSTKTRIPTGAPVRMSKSSTPRKSTDAKTPRKSSGIKTPKRIPESVEELKEVVEAKKEEVAEKRRSLESKIKLAGKTPKTWSSVAAKLTESPWKSAKSAAIVKLPPKTPLRIRAMKAMGKVQPAKQKPITIPQKRPAATALQQPLPKRRSGVLKQTVKPTLKRKSTIATRKSLPKAKTPAKKEETQPESQEEELILPEEYHPDSVSQLCEILNPIVQYQYAANKDFDYGTLSTVLRVAKEGPLVDPIAMKKLFKTPKKASSANVDAVALMRLFLNPDVLKKGKSGTVVDGVAVRKLFKTPKKRKSMLVDNEAIKALFNEDQEESLYKKPNEDGVIITEKEAENVLKNTNLRLSIQPGDLSKLFSIPKEKVSADISAVAETFVECDDAIDTLNLVMTPIVRKRWSENNDFNFGSLSKVLKIDVTTSEPEIDPVALRKLFHSPRQPNTEQIDAVALIRLFLNPKTLKEDRRGSIKLDHVALQNLFRSPKAPKAPAGEVVDPVALFKLFREEPPADLYQPLNPQEMNNVFKRSKKLRQSLNPGDLRRLFAEEKTKEKVDPDISGLDVLFAEEEVPVPSPKQPVTRRKRGAAAPAEPAPVRSTRSRRGKPVLKDAEELVANSPQPKRARTTRSKKTTQIDEADIEKANIEPKADDPDNESPKALPRKTRRNCADTDINSKETEVGSKVKKSTRIEESENKEILTESTVSDSANEAPKTPLRRGRRRNTSEDAVSKDVPKKIPSRRGRNAVAKADPDIPTPPEIAAEPKVQTRRGRSARSKAQTATTESTKTTKSRKTEAVVEEVTDVVESKTPRRGRSTRTKAKDKEFVSEEEAKPESKKEVDATVVSAPGRRTRRQNNDIEPKDKEEDKSLPPKRSTRTAKITEIEEPKGRGGKRAKPAPTSNSRSAKRAKKEKPIDEYAELKSILETLESEEKSIETDEKLVDEFLSRASPKPKTPPKSKRATRAKAAPKKKASPKKKAAPKAKKAPAKKPESPAVKRLSTIVEEINTPPTRRTTRSRRKV